MGARSLSLALLLLPTSHHPRCPHCTLAPLPCLAPQGSFAPPSRGERQLLAASVQGPLCQRPHPSLTSAGRMTASEGPPTLQVGSHCPATQCPPTGAPPRLWAPAPAHPAQADTSQSPRGGPLPASAGQPGWLRMTLAHHRGCGVAGCDQAPPHGFPAAAVLRAPPIWPLRGPLACPALGAPCPAQADSEKSVTARGQNCSCQAESERRLSSQARALCSREGP